MVVNPPPRMRIRRAIPTDIPALIALEKQAATAAHWSPEQYETVFSSEEPARVAFVIEDSPIEDARVQGFVVGRVVSEDWEIENIAVAGAARRRGLGTHLLEEFIGLARGRGLSLSSWKFANRTWRLVGFMRSMPLSRLADASVITANRKRTQSFTAWGLPDCTMAGAIPGNH